MSFLVLVLYVLLWCKRSYCYARNKKKNCIDLELVKPKFKNGYV